MAHIQIREADIQDLTILVEFQMNMAKETEDLILDETILTKGLKSVFENPEKGKFLVAFNSQNPDTILASLFIQKEWSEWRNGHMLWVHSVYVHPKFRGQKIFPQMYMHLQGIVAENESLKGIRLYVDKRNKKAQNVYKKLKMNSEHYDLYEWTKN